MFFSPPVHLGQIVKWWFISWWVTLTLKKIPPIYFYFHAWEAIIQNDAPWLDWPPTISPLHRAMIKVAIDEDCHYVAHGATGKGNDQIRFELGAYALHSSIQVILSSGKLPFECQNIAKILSFKKKWPKFSLVSGHFIKLILGNFFF